MNKIPRLAKEASDLIGKALRNIPKLVGDNLEPELIPIPVKNSLQISTAITTKRVK